MKTIIVLERGIHFRVAILLNSGSKQVTGHLR